MRLIIIGMNPGKGVTDRNVIPLFSIPRGSAGCRLKQMCGLTDYQYLTMTDRLNLWPLPGRVKSAHMRMSAANLARGGVLRDRSVLLLGTDVVDAFMRCLPVPEEDCTWVGIRQEVTRPTARRVAWIPHPSGLNRIYNDPIKKSRIQDFLSGAVMESFQLARQVEAATLDAG